MDKISHMFWWTSLAICVVTVAGLPDLMSTPTDPLIVRMKDQATLTCVAKNTDNFTVIWKKFRFGRAEVLSANTVKVTNDPRVSIVHNEGGNEWILTISDIKLADTAQYLCEVNSSPAVQVSILVTVTPPPPVAFPLSHNYTECCRRKLVANKCLGFCSLQNIILGNTGATPQMCREHLPTIAGCMADGRNHMPCCIRENIPVVCRDVCVGKFGLINETIVNHYTCSRYSRPTLACIAEGIELLPGPPGDFEVEPISVREIEVSWTEPIQNGNTITHYVVNVTELKTFDDPVTTSLDTDGVANITDDSSVVNMPTKYVEIMINGSQTSTTLRNLKPFTMYEMYVVSVNTHGTSLPTSAVRALTLLPPEKTTMDDTTTDANDNSTEIPTLPDIRGCCAEQGMTRERCLDLFCDPVKADVTNLTDMMICAPWINTSVTCLTGGKDHTDCCRQRGLPELCLPLCRGQIDRIDFRFFRCIAYMNAYTSCLLDGYGVLASAPVDPVIQATQSTWAIVRWKPPRKLRSTVTGYNVHYRSLTEEQVTYFTTRASTSPFLLDDLRPGEEYELFVSAVNHYGASESSPRIIFRTTAEPMKDDEESSTLDEESTGSGMAVGHNLTECCINAQLNSTCLPLCDYRAKMSELQRLAPVCLPDFHKLLKCAVGGRNHVPCCNRRMVNADCTSLCAGMIIQSSAATAAICIPFIPDIISCMEEGSTLLPGPVRELHALGINSTSVALQWEPPIDSNVTIYTIKYHGEYIDSSTGDKTSIPISEKSMNVSNGYATISTLRPDALYSCYVVSVNEYGSSMPSSILTFNTSMRAAASGVVSPPHSLTVSYKNTTLIILTWLPPDFSHPHDAVKYHVYYKLANESTFINFTTTALMAYLVDLTPNTEHFVYVTASTETGESWPSETLRVWTDPVFPAYVEMPRIHPSNQLEEFGTMTILCVATGTPTPKVSIFVSGKKIVEERSRHLVARLSNISRDMDVVTCTADNGYGVGSQATRRVKISYAPSIEAQRPEMTRIGERIVLKCIVHGHPKPHLTWWRDQDKLMPVIIDSRVVAGVTDDDGEVEFQLIIHHTQASDEGPYYCNAENPYGSKMDKVSLQLEEPPIPPANVSVCCMEQKVRAECLDACTFDVDIEAVIRKEECIPELSKLVYCAADGSDHKRCCQTWGIPRRCVGLCQGRHTASSPLCILTWTKEIVSCFQEGKKILPGMPQNFRGTVLTETSVLLEWDPPSKNPHTVQYYRVVGRLSTQKKGRKIQNDTHGLSLIMSGLKPGLTYEFAIKAGNHYGSSILSESIKAYITDNDIAEAMTEENSDKTVAIVVGVFLTIVVIAVAAFAFVYLRRRCRPRPPTGVSFENPSYQRDNPGDSVQMNGGTSPQDQVNGGVTSATTDTNWKSESLHSVPDYDALYEVPSDDRTTLKKSANKSGFL